jgi:hypothetical protein
MELAGVWAGGDDPQDPAVKAANINGAHRDSRGVETKDARSASRGW